MAIDAYPKLRGVQGDGASYLIIYGILQTLMLQQDAAKHIGSALGIKVKLPRELEEIRVIRNSAAGHPGQQKEKGQSKSCFITRMTVSPAGFQLMTVYSGDKEYKMQHVSVPSLIETQQEYLAEVLTKVIAELERQEMEHRKKHKGTKLADAFPQTTSYHLGKVLEATHDANSFPLGSINLETIAERVRDFKKRLTARGEWGVYESIDYHYELIEYPIGRLRAYFEGNDEMNEKDAYICASFVSGQLKSLEEIARELDEQYESAP